MCKECWNTKLGNILTRASELLVDHSYFFFFSYVGRKLISGFYDKFYIFLQFEADMRKLFCLYAFYCDIYLLFEMVTIQRVGALLTHAEN